jgi:hypothetical protein
LQARYTQENLGFAPVTSKTLVNGGSNKLVNIASTKMMKRMLGLQRDYTVMPGHDAIIVDHH